MESWEKIGKSIHSRAVEYFTAAAKRLIKKIEKEVLHSWSSPLKKLIKIN